MLKTNSARGGIWEIWKVEFGANLKVVTSPRFLHKVRWAIIGVWIRCMLPFIWPKSVKYTPFYDNFKCLKMPKMKAVHVNYSFPIWANQNQSTSFGWNVGYFQIKDIVIKKIFVRLFFIFTCFHLSTVCLRLDGSRTWLHLCYKGMSMLPGGPSWVPGFHIHDISMILLAITCPLMLMGSSIRSQSIHMD